MKERDDLADRVAILEEMARFDDAPHRVLQVDGHSCDIMSDEVMVKVITRVLLDSTGKCMYVCDLGNALSQQKHLHVHERGKGWLVPFLRSHSRFFSLARDETKGRDVQLVSLVPWSLPG